MLHSSQLSAELVSASGARLPLQPSLININEFLPQDLHNLRRAVRTAAKERGFHTFIRNGAVFIKKKKEDTSPAPLSLIPHCYLEHSQAAAMLELEGLRVCHLNVNSLRAHIERVRLFLESHPPFKVIAISETKLCPLIDDDFVSLEGYRLFRRDRNTRGGGVAFFINNCFRVTVLASSSHVWTKRPGFPEYLFCEISCHGVFPVFVAVVYRPPHAPFFQGNDFISSLQGFLQDYSSKVILGDFNADQLPVSYWKTEAPFVDAHDLITATIQAVLPRPSVSKDFTYRDFAALDLDVLLSQLAGSEWSVFDGLSSPDEMTACLGGNLGVAMDAAVPLKTVRESSKRKPWFTDEIIALVVERDRLYRVYKRTHSRQALLIYRTARDHAHREVEVARQLFFQRRLEPPSDPSLIWKELRRLGVVTGDDSRPDFDPDVLNRCFTGVSFDETELSLDGFLNSAELGAIPPAVGFSFRPVTADGVQKAVRHFSTEAKGTDGVPRSVVVAALPILTPHLVMLFNISFARSCFPSECRRSLIIALGKVKNPVSPNDFRLIALLCFLSKVLEKLASQQISGFLAERFILDSLQTGFRPFNGTQTALWKLTDDIRTGIDRRQLTMLLLFDFSKAFVSVCHVLLLRMLLGYGSSASSVRWLASYLGGHSQATLGGASDCSSFCHLNRGVPQGSVLGPLLFLLFINDVGVNVGPGVRHLIYADDLQIYLTFPREELEDATRRMSNAANRAIDWANANRLKLNVAKTKAIIFGFNVFVNDVYSLPDLSVSVGGSAIPFDTSVRSLRVVLDNKLSWKGHVAYVTQRVHSVMYRLRFFRASTTLGLRKHLIQALVFPLIDYCCLVYDGLSGVLATVIQRLINMTVRYIFGARRDEHITPYRLRLRWTTCEVRRTYFLACLTYKILRFGQPVYLADFFVASRAVRPVRGEVTPLMIKPFRTEAMRSSFHVSAAYLGNSIPSAVRDLPTLSSFRQTFHFTSGSSIIYKKYLLTRSPRKKN
ncbi:uncharacterized protein LOC107043393 [Diachasma alloeum]|uniref:uncharacterized protein LOC107043393 n=1 Tax=Diachasma alloeum TaxID=454923 RepID=UPI00073823E0|nr:uncharacterized protein LOC107043393 [Diachasma alloeum]